MNDPFDFVQRIFDIICGNYALPPFHRGACTFMYSHYRLQSTERGESEEDLLQSTFSYLTNCHFVVTFCTETRIFHLSTQYLILFWNQSFSWDFFTSWILQTISDGESSWKVVPNKFFKQSWIEKNFYHAIVHYHLCWRKKLCRLLLWYLFFLLL